MGKTKKDPLVEETDRIEKVLLRGGIHVGARHKQTRRALCTSLARALPGVITDELMAALFEEADDRGIERVGAWCASVLADDEDRKEYLPALRDRVQQAREKAADTARKAGVYGEHERIVPGTRRAAEVNGETDREHCERRLAGMMAAQHTGDRHSISRIADMHSMPIDQAREWIDRGIQQTLGMSLDEWQEQEDARAARAKAAFAKAKDGPEPTPKQARNSVGRALGVTEEDWARWQDRTGHGPPEKTDDDDLRAFMES